MIKSKYLKCPQCGAPLHKIFAAIGRLGGQSKSEAKVAAARRNAKLGGRPKKEKIDNDV